LGDLRKAVVAALGQAAGYRFSRLNLILNTIDVEIARGRARAQVLAGGRTSGAFGLGVDLVDKMLATVGAPRSLYGASGELLNAALEVTNDQLRKVWSDLGSGLKATIRRASLGITGVDAAVKEVAAAAAALKDWRAVANAETSAERIVRTEVMRTFSLATQNRLEQSDKRLGGGLKKYWLDADDDRVRDAHREAGERYGLKGEPGPIPVSKPFVVDGEELMFPRDPQGSAGNVINCRCVSVPYVEDVGKESGAAAA
jgi:hypothetical protein